MSDPFSDLIPQGGSQQGGGIPVTRYSIPKSALGGTQGDELSDPGTARGVGIAENELGPGVVAVNPSVYPYGTIFRNTDTNEVFLAGDKQGNRNPNVVDLYSTPSTYKRESGTMPLVPIDRIATNQIPKSYSGVSELLANYGKVPQGEGAYASLGKAQQPQDPFADLLPQAEGATAPAQPQAQEQAADPFADLLPQQQGQAQTNPDAAFLTAPSPTPEQTGKVINLPAMEQPSKVPAIEGQVEAGNIDLNNRPVVKNADGTISTVRSMSIGTDKGETLIPTVSEDGRIMSNDEAIAQFKQTGKNLGTFANANAATAYAKQLSKNQDAQYSSKEEPPASYNPIENALRNFANTAATSTLNTFGGAVRYFNNAQQRDLKMAQEELAKAQADGEPPEYINEIQGRIDSFNEQIPQVQEAAKSIIDLSNQYPEAYGVNPKDESTSAQIGRGLGQVASFIPTMALGPAGAPLGGLQAASQAYEGTYQQTLQTLKSQGVTDQALLEDKAQREASLAAVKSLPQLGVYMFGGKLASVGVSKLLSTQKPLIQGVAGAVAGSIMNTAAGATIRKFMGESVMPTVESLTQDIAFGLFHGVGTGVEAQQKLKFEEQKRKLEEQKLGGPAITLAPSANPEVNKKEAEILASADAQAPAPSAEVMATTPDLTSLILDQTLYDEGSPEWNAIQKQIDELNKPTGEATTPSSTLDPQLQDLTDEQNKLVIEELPKYPEGSVGRKQVQDRIDAIRLQQAELAKQRELVISTDTQTTEVTPAKEPTPTPPDAGGELTASLVESGTNLESFGRDALAQLAEYYGIDIPKDASRGEIIDAINAKRTAEAPTETSTRIPKGEAYNEQAVYPIKVSDLTFYQEVIRGNENDFNDVNKISKSIEQEGFREPLTFTYDPKSGRGILTDGNHRIAAAQRLGIEEAPIILNISYGKYEDNPQNSKKIAPEGTEIKNSNDLKDFISKPTEQAQAPKEEVVVPVSLEEAKTPEEVDAFVKSEREKLKSRFRTDTDNAEINSRNKESIGKQSKALGMQAAARKRQITGQLTAKEQAAIKKREASNYVGKPVSVEGRNGTITGNPFGRVKVKFTDGTEATYLPEKIESPVSEDKQAPAKLENPYKDIERRYANPDADAFKTTEDLVVAIEELANKENNKFLKDAIAKYREGFNLGEDPAVLVDNLMAEVEREGNYREQGVNPSDRGLPKADKKGREGYFISSDPVIKYLNENRIRSRTEQSKYAKSRGEKLGGEYDDVPTLPPYHSALIYGGEQTIDQAHQALVDSGDMPVDSKPRDLWDKIAEASRSAINSEKAEAERVAAEKEQAKKNKELENLRKTNPEAYKAQEEKDLQSHFNRMRRREGGFLEFPQPIQEAAIRFGESVRKAGMEFREWAKEMTSRLGEGVKGYLRQIWNAISTGGGRFLERGAERGAVDIGAEERFKPKDEIKVKISDNDAKEIEYKLGILRDEEDLLDDYGLTKEQVDNVLNSIPKNGGEWYFPANLRDAIISEMQDHIVVLKDQYNDLEGAASEMDKYVGKSKGSSKREITRTIKSLKSVIDTIKSGWNKNIGGGFDTGGRSLERAAEEAKFAPKAPTEQEAFAKKASDAILKGRGTPITEQEMGSILARKFPGISPNEVSDLYATASGTPKPPAPYAGQAVAQETPEQISIRRKDQEDQVRRGILTATVPAGEGMSQVEITERGKQNLAQGADPLQALELAKTGNLESLITARAYYEGLQKQKSDILRKFGPNSPEYKRVADEAQTYYEGLREAGTAASTALSTFKGQNDLSDAADIATAYRSITGEEPTLAKHEQIRKVADKVDRTIKESDKASEDHKVAMDEGLAEVEVQTPASVEEGRQQVADLSDAQGKKAKDEIDRLNNELEQTKKDLEEVKQAKATGQDAASLKAYYEAKLKDLQGQLETQPKFGKQVFEQARKIVEKLEKRAEEADKRLKKKLAQLGAFPDVTIVKDVAEIMAAHIARSGLKFAESSALVLEKYGPNIRPYLKDAWAMADNIAKGEGIDKKTSKKERQATQKPVAKMTPEEKATESLRKRIAQAEKKINDLNSGKITTPKDVEKVTSDEIKRLEDEYNQKKKELGDARLKAKQRELFEKGKVGDDLNPEQVKTLWESAKRFYLDKGESDYDKMISDLASDFGLTPQQVRKAFGTPKGAKKASDEMYLKQRNRQMALDEAKRWLVNQKASWIGRVFGAAAEKTFKLAIFGHGTAFIGTHAPQTLYTNPKLALKAWLKGLRYSFTFKSGRVQNIVDNKDLINRPSWVVARKGGLENDPREIRREGATPARSDSVLAKALDTISGGRGFDALFHLRQDMFDQAWEQLSVTQRTPEMAEMYANAINNATGFTKGGRSSAGILQSPITKILFFAPKLIASRFKWLIQDPIRMLGTFGKMANPFLKVTPEERSSAIYEAKNKAKFLGVMTGTLLANQALLSITGSNQSINFLDPKKRDWLAYKGFGYDLATIGAFTRIIRLVAQEYNAVFGELSRWQKAKGGREQAMKDAVYTYLRSGFSPITRDIIVASTGKDYVGNTVPWSKEQPDRGRRKLTWRELIQEQFAPIPISEAATQKEVLPAAVKASSAAFLGTRLETPTDIEEYEKSLKSKASSKSSKPFYQKSSQSKKSKPFYAK